MIDNVIDEGRSKDGNGKGNGTGFGRVAAVLALALLGVTLTAGAAAGASWSYDDGITQIKVVDRVDKDGDGYVSSFGINLVADTEIRENGKKYTGKLLQNKGHPKFEFKAWGPNLPRHLTLDVVEVDYGAPMLTEGSFKDFTLPQMRGTTFPDGPDPYRNLYRGQKINKIQVAYWESDTAPHLVDVPADVGVDLANLPLKKSIRMELPSEDKKAAVEIDSNVDGASVFIDGGRVGSTPYSGQLPVDIAKREGKTTIRVEKDGYTTASKRLKLSPPTTVDLEMEKVKKPLVVKASEDGATVTIDGSTAGTAPLSTKVWTERSVDVSVEKDGYETWTRNGIAPPATISADLVSTDSDTDGNESNDSYVYVPSDPTLTDPTFTYSFDDIVSDISLPALDHANFTASPRTAETGENVSLDASPSFALSGESATYRWDFGDGSTGTGLNATHSYSDDGTYEVTLTLAGPNGTLDTAAVNVTVENRAPTPGLSLPESPVTGRSVTLTANGSVDPDGSVVEYRWDLDGDGSTDATTTEPRTSHVYENPGTYAPRLEAVDDDGATGSASLPSIKVAEPNEGPVARIDGLVAEPSQGEELSLDASSSRDPDGSIESYRWDLGDGETATGAAVGHAYGRGGTYEVVLTVFDDDGAVDSANASVTVTADGAGAAETEPTRTATATATEPGTGTSPVAKIIEAILELLGA